MKISNNTLTAFLGGVSTIQEDKLLLKTIEDNDCLLDFLDVLDEIDAIDGMDEMRNEFNEFHEDLDKDFYSDYNNNNLR